MDNILVDFHTAIAEYIDIHPSKENGKSINNEDIRKRWRDVLLYTGAGLNSIGGVEVEEREFVKFWMKLVMSIRRENSRLRTRINSLNAKILSNEKGAAKMDNQKADLDEELRYYKSVDGAYSVIKDNLQGLRKAEKDLEGQLDYVRDKLDAANNKRIDRSKGAILLLALLLPIVIAMWFLIWMESWLPSKSTFEVSLSLGELFGGLLGGLGALIAGVAYAFNKAGDRR